MKNDQRDETRVHYVFNSKRFVKLIVLTTFLVLFFGILGLILKDTKCLIPIICIEAYLITHGTNDPYDKNDDGWFKEVFI